jgi:hypothetical protein
MTETERLTLAETLQNGTALSRLTAPEIVAALQFMESVGYTVTAGYDVTNKGTENAALEGDQLA